MTMPDSTPHLTLAELAASEGNRPLPASAATHLDACAACQARSRDAVADGVRFLLARVQPPPGLMGSVLEAIDAQHAPARRHGPAVPGHLRWPAARGQHRAKRAALAAAAAAVLLGATAAGLGTALGPALGPAGRPGGAEGGGSAITHAGVTLTECTGLRLQVLGRMLQQVSGTSLELAGPLTVTTSAGTEILREVTGTAADISDGAQVLVIGTTTGAAIAATLVAVMPGTGNAAPQGQSGTGAVPGLAYGTADDARGSRFTVAEGDGARVPVTLSASSSVIRSVPSSLGELRAGQATSVVVSQGTDETLAAVTVEQSSLPAAALNALRQALPELGAGGPGPGLGPGYFQPGRQRGPIVRSLPSPPPPNAALPKGSAAPGLLPYLLGGSSRPFASLGCDPSAITSVNLLALALAG